MSPARTNSKIEAEYRSRTRRSAELYARACKVIPAGLTHDSRTLLPYPLYAARAAGPRKWDVDGNEYVDYFGGHGALLLGHRHPTVLEAVQEQAPLGTHWGSAHELEVRWAELVNRLIPCAGRVRFTASGTEASHLALRLARAFTGKPKVIRFTGHFHGWHDGVTAGAMSHFDGGVPTGIPAALVEQTILLPADDIGQTAQTFATRTDIAAVLIEPSGASWGQVPLSPGFLAGLHELTRSHGALLVFDEVITGFRWSRGGAQQRYAITPDLCVLAKIVCDMLERYAARTASRPRDRYRCLLFHIARSCGSPTLSTRSKLASASASDGDLCPCGWQPQLISNVIGSGSKFRHLLHAGMRRRVNEARHC